MTQITLKYISEILGISISTVSRALKNHPDISVKTKTKVNELAATLEYEPNANAIHLRTQKNNLFGIIIPELSNYFYHSFIATVELESKKNNFSVMIFQSNNNEDTERDNIKICRQNRVSGLFACSTSVENLKWYQKLKEHDIPVVFFDKVPEDAQQHKICVADTEAAAIAARRLISADKKNILAFFGDPAMLLTKLRWHAFEAAVKEKDPEVKLHCVFANNANEAESICNEALKKENDAVFCMSDELLTGVLKSMQRKGIHYPTDVALLAISNGFIPKLFYPEITYVETSGAELGILAFNHMMDCIAGNNSPKSLMTSARLIEGGSV